MPLDTIAWQSVLMLEVGMFKYCPPQTHTNRSNLTFIMNLTWVNITTFFSLKNHSTFPSYVLSLWLVRIC